MYHLRFALLFTVAAALGCGADDVLSVDGRDAAPVDDKSPGTDGTAATTSAREATLVSTWPSTPGSWIGDMAMASNEKGAAIAYVESTDVGSEGERSRLLLQRLNEAGTRVGSPVELGTAQGQSSMRSISLASNGFIYVGCWSSADQITCAADYGAGLVRPAYKGAGDAAAIVNGSGAWLIAIRSGQYGGPTASIELQRLVTGRLAFFPSGTPVSFPVSSDSIYFHRPPLLVATRSGYVLVAGEKARVHRLDHELKPIGQPVDLGVPFWAYTSLAANETKAVVSLAKPYGGHLFLIAQDKVTSTFELDGGGKTGVALAVIEDGPAFSGAWVGAEGRINIRGPLSESINDGLGDGNLAIAQVGEAILGATTVNVQGGSEVRIFRASPP